MHPLSFNVEEPHLELIAEEIESVNTIDLTFSS